MLHLYYVHAYDHGTDYNMSRWVTASSFDEAQDLWRTHISEEDEHDPDDFEVWVEKAPPLLSSHGVHD